jgi:hypothetical protein
MARHCLEKKKGEMLILMAVLAFSICKVLDYSEVSEENLASYIHIIAKERNILFTFYF